MTGQRCDTIDAAKAAIATLAGRMRKDGPRAVLLTSLETASTPGDRVDMMVAEGGAFHLLRTPRLPVSVNGAGDAIAALFLFHRLRTGDAARALEAAGSSIHGLLRRTAEAGSREVQLIAAQEEFVAPSRRFLAERV